jgi:hypothetical protein
VRDIGSIVAGIAVGLAWLVLWEGLVLAPGVPFLIRKAEDRARRRERLKQMGKLRFVLLFGVLGYGFAFALALTIADYIGRNSFDWTRELSKMVFLSVVFGLISGFRNWSEFRDPVPFPPNYPPQE